MTFSAALTILCRGSQSAALQIPDQTQVQLVSALSVEALPVPPLVLLCFFHQGESVDVVGDVPLQELGANQNFHSCVFVSCVWLGLDLHNYFVSLTFKTTLFVLHNCCKSSTFCLQATSMFSHNCCVIHILQDAVGVDCWTTVMSQQNEQQGDHNLAFKGASAHRDGTIGTPSPITPGTERICSTQLHWVVLDTRSQGCS